MLAPYCLCLDLICVVLRSIPQIVSQAWIISCLPGLNQYKAKDKASSTGTQHGVSCATFNTLPLSHCAPPRVVWQKCKCKFTPKRGGSSAATTFGVNLHLFLKCPYHLTPYHITT